MQTNNLPRIMLKLVFSNILVNKTYFHMYKYSYLFLYAQNVSSMEEEENTISNRFLSVYYCTFIPVKQWTSISCWHVELCAQEGLKSTKEPIVEILDQWEISKQRSSPIIKVKVHAKHSLLESGWGSMILLILDKAFNLKWRIHK